MNTPYTLYPFFIQQNWGKKISINNVSASIPNATHTFLGCRAQYQRLGQRGRREFCCT